MKSFVFRVEAEKKMFVVPAPKRPRDEKRPSWRNPLWAMRVHELNWNRHALQELPKSYEIAADISGSKLLGMSLY